LTVTDPVQMSEESIAVHQGSMLLGAIEKRAVAAGATRPASDVSAKNEDARRFYERHEMTAESNWPDLEFVGYLFPDDESAGDRSVVAH